jgi:deferrochelatase/peroxidase EfeB
MNIENESPISKETADEGYKKLFQDIQGNILKSHARPHVKLLFLRFEAGKEDVRKWIRKDIAPLVTSFSEQMAITETKKQNRTSPSPRIAQRALVADHDPLFGNFFITSKGVEKLGLELPQDTAQSFTDGMRGRITADPQPEDWESAYQQPIDLWNS